MTPFELSYPLNTVTWNGKLVERLPEEKYLPSMERLKQLGITRLMLSGYVTIENFGFDPLEETKRLGGLMESMGMRPAQHHGLSAVYAAPGNDQTPVIERLIKAVHYTANLNSPVLVIHPGHYYDPESWKKGVATTDFFDSEVAKHGVEAVIETAAANLHAAGAEVEKLGVKIAVENVDRFEPMGRFEYLTKLIRLADSPAVGFCLDTGHAHCCGLTPIHDWIEAMGKKLFTTHVHDNRGARLQALTPARWISPKDIDEHLPPGFGTIPWIDVIRDLHAAGFEGPLNFESGPWPEMPVEEGYRMAISYWRTQEKSAAK